MNSITHYQTSFRVDNPDGDTFMRLKASVYGWIVTKEKDRVVKNDKSGFFSRCDWRNMFETHSSICTAAFFSEGDEAWAIHYTEIDKECGRKRFWYSDIGLKKDGGSVVVSVRVSFAWNEEDLSIQQEAPTPTVPKVIRFILQDYHVYSGRPEFRLVEKPIQFNKPGMGKALCDFIQSSDRRYPLIVFNGDGADHVKEAGKLARELTGKSLVAVVANSPELAEEIKIYLPEDFRIPFGQFRIFFPFNQRRNSPLRHRWYDLQRADYSEQRHGIVNGLLRSHNLLEKGAVETIDDVYSLINRSKLLKLEAASPEQQKQLDEFLQEHSRVAAERDQWKQESGVYASEVDRLEAETRKLEWQCKDYESRMDAAGQGTSTVDVSKLLPKLPSNLLQVAEAASRFFPRLIITEDALESAKEYHDCKSIGEAWEMLRHLSDAMYKLKFESGEQKDWERTFQDETGYELAMSEGRNTKKDKKLMGLRKILHDGREYDITPHLKHGNQVPKMLRIHFDFDEVGKKIVVGYIGSHIPNATTKTI